MMARRTTPGIPPATSDEQRKDMQNCTRRPKRPCSRGGRISEQMPCRIGVGPLRRNLYDAMVELPGCLSAIDRAAVRTAAPAVDVVGPLCRPAPNHASSGAGFRRGRRSWTGSRKVVLLTQGNADQ